MKYFQGYLGIFRDIDAYSSTLTDAQQRLRGESFHAVSENWKKCPGFRKKGPDSVHLWIKFSIQSVVLRVSRGKNSKMFPYGISFSCVFDECLSKCSSSTNYLLQSSALKHFWLCICSQTLFFLQKSSILNVWHCWEYVFVWQLLSNFYSVDLILCTASDTFRILAYSTLGFFRYMRTYLIIFSVAKAYQRILRHY